MRARILLNDSVVDSAPAGEHPGPRYSRGQVAATRELKMKMKDNHLADEAMLSIANGLMLPSEAMNSPPCIDTPPSRRVDHCIPASSDATLQTTPSQSLMCDCLNSRAAGYQGVLSPPMPQR